MATATATKYLRSKAADSKGKPCKIQIARPCVRCGGSGQYSEYHGVCYRCGGNGSDPVPSKEWSFPTNYSDEQIANHYAKLEAKRLARMAKKEAQSVAIFAENMASIPALAILDQWRIENGIANEGLEYDAYDLHVHTEWTYVGGTASSIVSQAHRGHLSAKQIAVLEKEVESVTKRMDRKAAQEAEKAAAGPVPTGKALDLEGVVVSRKEKWNDFGCTMKLTMKLDSGACIWFTEPRSVVCEVGQRISVRLGQVTASEEDASFGFGKRPTRFVILEEGQ